MANKKFMCGMAALALSFGMALAGCNIPTNGEYGKSPESAINLTLGYWHNGRISEPDENGNRDVKWYTFRAASASSTYTIQWVDTDNYGGYTMVPTCDIVVSAYQSDKVTYFFLGADGGATSKTISNYSGTVYLRVQGYSSSTGTYAIRYTSQ